MRITVGNLKGGSTKTTTAVYLAFGLARSGRVLLVDADAGQGSVLSWSEAAGTDWPANITVIPWSTRDLAQRVSNVSADYDHIVLDIGPKNPYLLRQALQVAPLLIVPVVPNPMDIHEIPATFEVAQEVADTAPTAVEASVLLARCKPRSTLARAARQSLEELGLPVMDAQVTDRNAYALSYGTAVLDLLEYDDVFVEITVDEGVEV